MNYSPSLYHQRLMRASEPAMTWKGREVGPWQRELRARLAGLLGFDRQAGARVPLNVRSLWRRRHPAGTLEKVVFTSERDVDVPAYVCLPRNAEPPYRFFICLQGHTTGMHNSIAAASDDDTRPKAPGQDRDFAISCMRHGMAALCIEQRSMGERGETVQGQSLDYLCHQAAMNALLLGKTLIGERVFDVDRALDFLAGRGDADMDHVGIMGNSGGGTVSLYAGALLPRLRYVMPSCCFSTFQASIQSQFHCVCNYVPGLLRLAEMGDVAGLVAPRPLILVSGEKDGIFPVAQARSEFERTRRIYAACGAEDRCHHLVCRGGHKFYPEQAWGLFLERYGSAG